MGNSSLKSEYIRGLALHCILVLSKFRNRGKTLMHGAALPVTIFIGLHLIEVSVLAYTLVHAFLL